MLVNRAKLYIAVFYVLCRISISPAQDSIISPKYHYYVNVNANYGFFWAHHNFMRQLAKGHIRALTVSLSRQHHGYQPWEQIYNYPSSGIALQYFNLGNPEELGSAVAVFSYINFPIIRKKRFTFGYRWGAGLGFVEKPFDLETNKKNIAIGSVVNMMMSILLETRWQLSNHLQLYTGLSIAHMSNADFKQPNLGINLPGADLGLSYRICSREKGNCIQTRFQKHDTLPKQKKIECAIVCGFATKRADQESATYGAASISVSATMPVGRKRRLGCGVDLFYDASNIVFFNKDINNQSTDSKFAFIRPGVHISHEVVIGPISGLVEMGAYLYYKYKGDGLFYHRAALRYHVLNNYIISFSLKTHWANADFFEWGLGYKF